MKPIRVPDLAPERFAELERLYRSTRNVRLRTRAQMVLLAAERGLTAAQIAEIVRASEETVRRWWASPGKTDTLEWGLLSPPKGGPHSAGTNTALPTGIQTGSRRALPLF